ncbi:hypothetical protein [Cohnella silvisoli]|uniref:Uncharacterized protein n=1 Tax=Cohnella silvisoli TaxID=2873699 RepID=A0ABV1L2Z2_9BACL|nr:hypothetical protein [Cohnella silvisoli]MCD9026022.1 hypothetical protein [Cohnella silvisoli]
MRNNSISKIFERAITSAFDHHLESSAPTTTPLQISVTDSEAEFIKSLTPEQKKAYSALSSDMTEHETRNSEHYYRLGFLDGLNAWRGV